MKMKRWLALCLAGLLLFSGCRQTEQPPQPVYDPVPAVAEGGLTVNGKALSGFYTADDIRYLKMSEFAEAVGGSFEIFAGIEEHQAALTVGETTYSFKTSELPETQSAVYYFKGGLYDGAEWYQPAEELLSYFEFHLFLDEEQNHSYYTAYPLSAEIPAGIRVPTLMYHAVSDDCWGISSLFVSPSRLEEQLQYLTENGYTPIFFEDLAKVDQIEKPVLLTFDDGYADNYTELFPLLKKYQVKATVFMIMGSVGAEHYLTKAQIKEMDASGLVSFQSHTVSHEFLSTRTAEQLEYELLQSKVQLARLIGKESFVLCYPTGKYSQESLAATEKYYQFGLLMSGSTYVTGNDPFTITRKYVARSTEITDYKELLRS